MSPLIIVLALLALITQIGGASLLPRTQAFTDPVWTAACLALYALSLYLIALMIRMGVQLSLIVPFMAAAVPLAAIAVGYFAYGEVVSIAKLSLLVAACCAIGVAGAMS